MRSLGMSVELSFGHCGAITLQTLLVSDVVVHGLGVPEQV